VSENPIGAAPGIVSGPVCVILPGTTGAFRPHENGNPQLAAHVPDASDAGML
jgi:hypothetical protein